MVSRRRRRRVGGSILLLLILQCSRTEAFAPVSQKRAFGISSSDSYRYDHSDGSKTSTTTTTTTTTSSDNILNDDTQRFSRMTPILHAKKKANAKAAALEALEALESAIDEPMSLKDQKAAEKKAKKKKKDIKAAALETLESLDLDDDDDDDQPRKLSKKELRAQAAGKVLKTPESQPEIVTAVQQEGPTGSQSQPPVPDDQQQQQPAKKMSAKEAAMQKLLDLEAEQDARMADEPQDDQSTKKLTKKELKALKKKQEKEAAKAAKKAAKKAAASAEDTDQPLSEDTIPVDADETAPPPVQEKKRITLEEKIRKERPPPRIRVMESAQPGFSSLRLEGVGITFRDQEVLTDVTWGVQTGDRIGLVGQNGAGKTTQLRILAGELEPTTGDVVKSSKDLRVAMLRQEFVDELVKTRTLKEEFMSVFREETKLLQDIRDAEADLETLGPDEEDKMQNVLDRMQDLQAKADSKGVYTLEARCKKVMDLMGFTDDEGDDLVASFSGGWKMRIGLGKVLLEEPNILLLDEPTNHLDLESVEWLEAFLRQQNIPMIIVSHDREFLDQVCTKIVDAEGGICTEYDGNYSRFLGLKKSRMDSWNAAYKAQEKKIKEERQWINKFKVKQPQAVKQREAKLKKFMSSDDFVKKPPHFGKPFRFRFPDAPRLSPEVAEVRHLTHAYRNGETENKLFDDCELFVEKGDRIAVVGPNGSGKSTLLRFMLDREAADEGEAKIVGANVVTNYFEQNQADALDLEKTVVQTIQGASSDQSYNELRALLGQFLFKGDAVEKKVKFLSGGEKARLSLACMMLTPANLLILDEPTNHLDIPAKEMLEEALQHFDGSIMVISHDRYFISKVATTIVAIEDKKLVKYQGDYKFYMDKSSHMKEKIEARYVQGVARIGAAPIIDMEEQKKKKGNFGGAKTAHMVTRKDKGVKNAKRQQVK